jgi:hypothetical protein
MSAIIDNKNNKNNINETNGTTEVLINDFLSWFDNKLAQFLILDLSDINIELRLLFDNMQLLKKQSETFKSYSMLLPASQAQSRVVKLCTQIDTIVISCQYDYSGIYPPILEEKGFIDKKQKKLKEHIKSLGNETYMPILLPDSDYLKDLISKIRSRLRTIEEMASSKNLSRADVGNGQGPLAIRETVLNILNILERLEKYQLKQIMITDYISNIKSIVHQPLLNYAKKIENLPPLQSLLVTLNSESILLNKSQDKYKVISKVPILLEVSQIKIELEGLENILIDLLAPIKTIFEYFISKNDGKTNSFSSLQWVKNLSSIILYPNKELLGKLIDKTIMNNFLLHIIGLQKYIKGLKTNQLPPSNNELLINSIKNIELFNKELFLAYHEDWYLRVNLIDSKTTNNIEFLSNYNNLEAIRTEYIKSSEIYEKSMSIYQDLLIKYKNEYSGLQNLVVNLEELCFDELNVKVNINVKFPQLNL